MTASRWVLVSSGLVLACGCSVLAGVDFGDTHARDEGVPEGGAPTTDAGSGSGDDGSASVVEDGAVIIHADGGCAPDESVCNGVCVKKSDPQFGCGGPACMPCSLPLTATATCAAGKCVPATCAQGRGDCDKDPANGCEADLSAPANCGSCTVKCAGAASLCSPAGCVGACPGGTVSCGTSCVDTQGSVTNCGACAKVCGSGANSDPSCAGGKCGIVCHDGFADCDSSPDNGCEPLTTFYKDGDGDGIGGASSTRACTAPAGFKAAGGDCDDTNASVFPGQTAYFGAPYSSAGTPSFDYDCDGNEIESPAESGDHFLGSCSGACDNAGYLTAFPARSGVGVDAYCGSTRYRTCINGGALAPSPLVPIGGGCTSQIDVGNAVPCK